MPANQASYGLSVPTPSSRSPVLLLLSSRCQTVLYSSNTPTQGSTSFDPSAASLRANGVSKLSHSGRDLDVDFFTPKPSKAKSSKVKPQPQLARRALQLQSPVPTPLRTVAKLQPSPSRTAASLPRSRGGSNTTQSNLSAFLAQQTGTLTAELILQAEQVARGDKPVRTHSVCLSRKPPPYI